MLEIESKSRGRVYKVKTFGTIQADLLAIKGKYDEALKAYDKCINSPETGFEAHFASMGKIILLRDLGRYEDAILNLNKMIEKSPDNSWAWNNKAEIFMASGRYNEAIMAFDKIFDLAEEQDIPFYPKYQQQGMALLGKGISLHLSSVKDFMIL